jgi:hypothetical protein
MKTIHLITDSLALDDLNHLDKTIPDLTISGLGKIMGEIPITRGHKAVIEVLENTVHCVESTITQLVRAAPI